MRVRIYKTIKRIVVGLILACWPGFLHAQNMSTVPTVGVRGGILLSTVTGDEAIDQYAKKKGLQLGLTGAYYVHPMLSIRAELNYEGKGGKFTNHEMNMNLDYISLPLYLKFNFIGDPEIYIYVGAYGSYLLSAKTMGTYEITLTNDYITESINEDIRNNLNQFDVGLVAGLGVQGRFNRWLDIFLDLRYTKGFLNLDNGTSKYRYNFNYTEFWPQMNLEEPKNKAFMLTAGFIYYYDPR